MKKSMALAVILLMFVGCRSLTGEDPLRLYDLESGRILAGGQAVEEMNKARLVLVGEQHSSKTHHQAQLAVIQALHRSGKTVAVGLEMFRQESQAELDRWISGETQEPDFTSIYLDNWNFDWTLYRPIFHYARENKLPLVGLNVPRSVTSQVARQGFESLTDEQKAGLDTVTCDVTPQYREFINKAYGAHAHSAMDFENFCEAQLLWDSAMAKRALDYLEKHPDTTLVLLAGAGHARKPGIPAQVRKHSNTMPVLVLLPETETLPASEGATTADADYLIVAF